eukprot:TRINITY_DN79981_c0_g1_i1.p1 TRINITY_DN79981_c0_g1~~TRINITY_DN79981_c0_g1_i1.p1  ORF type:complete len:530 (-),score=106.43 TRINITY_DN79981_c0_g1_i1:99-1688(-)
MEPVQEVGYRNRPPLLEDASIRGVLRFPIKDAMGTLEERDAIEADFRWYRYSKFAAPWLFFTLLIAVAVFCLTAWQQVGGYKTLSANTVGIRTTRVQEGIPRIIVSLDEIHSKYEAGHPKFMRNIRIASVFIALFAITGTLLTLYSKPRPGTRNALNYIWVLLFIASFVLGWIDFAVSVSSYASETHPPQQCIWNNANTNEPCIVRKGVAVIAIVADACVAMGSILSAIYLAWYSKSGDWRIKRTGWREQERDAETEVFKQKNPIEARFRKVSNVRIWFLSFILFFTFSAVVVLTVFIVLLHQDRNIEKPVESWNGLVRGKDLTSHDGWPAKNTRLRYSLSIMAILLILLNAIPFVHKAINFTFAWLYLFIAVMCFVSFGLDVHQMHLARQLPCPTGMKCLKAPFIATAIIEFFLGLALVWYVIYEFLCKCCSKSKWSQRNYAPHEIKKHDLYLDSMRPVRCEVTGRAMTAKEYVYRWRFIAGTQPELSLPYPPGLAPFPQINPDAPVLYDTAPPPPAPYLAQQPPVVL